MRQYLVVPTKAITGWRVHARSELYCFFGLCTACEPIPIIAVMTVITILSPSCYHDDTAPYCSFWYWAQSHPINICYHKHSTTKWSYVHSGYSTWWGYDTKHWCDCWCNVVTRLVWFQQDTSCWIQTKHSMISSLQTADQTRNEQNNRSCCKLQHTVSLLIEVFTDW